MAKFVYRMQSILDIKTKLETQAKIAYGIANRKYLDEQQILQQYMIRRGSYERHLKEVMSGTLNLKEVAHARTDLVTMKTLVRRQMMEVHKAEVEMERARAELNEVIRERKTHEKLREKAFEEFRKEYEGAESKEMDGLVSYVYNTK